jgi:hypothetical protein
METLSGARFPPQSVALASRMLIAPAAAVLPEGPEIVEMMLPLPVLTGYPTPIAKTKVLLESAAEVEHALMVQYLYAAYSLKDVSEVADPVLKLALDMTRADSWPRVLFDIAREEMGHLMSVENLLLLVGLAPNLEREDFPPRKDIYPFKLHLERLSQRSLAKYVVAESPLDANGIDDINDLAKEVEGAVINHVGIIYGLLGLIFATKEQVAAGGSGSLAWDQMVRDIWEAAKGQNNDPAAWHLPDDAFHPESDMQQGDPGDWQTPAGPHVSDLRVHRVKDREAARKAICDIAEQGEGATNGPASHFDRFRSIFRGQGAIPPFPATDDWPTRNVPTDPKVGDITESRTRRWAELCDLRYDLLLGFLEHYLLTTGQERQILMGWIFTEMRSRLGHIARELTAMKRTAAGDVAAAPFTLPEYGLPLPNDETARWQIHKRRLETAITKVEEMQAANEGGDAASEFLAKLLASDKVRLEFVSTRAGGPAATTSFIRDIQPLFRPKDIDHMRAVGIDLSNYDEVRAQVDMIVSVLESPDESTRMPPPPDQKWTKTQIDLLRRWKTDEFPP